LDKINLSFKLSQLFRY